jgi:hypothetical protein
MMTDHFKSVSSLHSTSERATVETVADRGYERNASHAVGMDPVAARQAERRKFWTGLIARHKQSGKTVEAFCQENGVGGPSFYAWRKRLMEKSRPIGFAMVEMSGVRPQRGEPVELILPTGDRLHIHAGVDAATLRLVLSALREAR